MAELPKHTNVNNHFIDLIDDIKLFYSPIYSLGLIELKMLKTYIKTNLVNGFIKSSKLPTGALIEFIDKKNGKF